MKILKHLPNTLTCCNLLCGTLAIIEGVLRDSQAALLLVLGAAVFDFLDGLAARALKAYSPMGKELDSLADMVSFGVAPALVATAYMFAIFRPAPWLLCSIPLLIAPFSALRLAKFNIDDSQTYNFRGLATPACALFIVSLAASSEHYLYGPAYGLLACIVSNPAAPWVFAFICLALCFLLVSNVPMFSMKFRNPSFAENRARFIFLSIAAVEIILTAVLRLHFSLCICTVIFTYILINLLMLLKKTVCRQGL